MIDVCRRQTNAILPEPSLRQLPWLAYRTFYEMPKSDINGQIFSVIPHLNLFTIAAILNFKYFPQLENTIGSLVLFIGNEQQRNTLQHMCRR